MDLPGWSGDRPVTPSVEADPTTRLPGMRAHGRESASPRVRGERSRRGRSEHGRAATRGRRCGRGCRGGRTAGAAASSPSSRRNPVPRTCCTRFGQPAPSNSNSARERRTTRAHLSEVNRTSLRLLRNGPGAHPPQHAPARVRSRLRRGSELRTRARFRSRTSASGLAAGRAGARIRASGPKAHSCTSTPRMILPSRRSWYPSLICSREYCLVTSSSSLSWPAS